MTNAMDDFRPRYHYELGHASLALGEGAAAASQFEAALALRPDWPEARRSLDLARAVATDGTVPLVPTDLMPPFVLEWQLLRRAGEMAEEDWIARAEALLGRHPDHRVLQHRLASRLMVMGRLTAAHDHFGHALRLAPENASAHGGMATLLARMGRFDAAHHHHRRALDLEPGNGGLTAALGLTLARQGRYGEALEALERGAAAAPGIAWITVSRGHVLIRLGRFEDAVAACRQALSEGGAEPWYSGTLAWALALTGRSDLAADALEKARALDPAFAWCPRFLWMAPETFLAGCGGDRSTITAPPVREDGADGRQM